MNKTELLLHRLNEIGDVLSHKPTALALIGLGSVGLERDRLDQYSDLDFFVIVKSGSKPHYLNDLTWLTDIAPVAYSFANTQDGCKLLYEDGVFCEFAIFEETELEQAAFTPGKIIWKAPGVSETISQPKQFHQAAPSKTSEWLLGEALTNLYIGLQRDHRGEKLSAMRFIQSYAFDRILELSIQIETATDAPQDPFSPERRYEQRYPHTAQLLPSFLQGYEKNRESAMAMLSFLDSHFAINTAMKEAILGLCQAYS